MTQARWYRSRHNYVNQLKTGAKTTQDMVFSLDVSGRSVARMMKVLREDGIVTSSRVLGAKGNLWQHELLPGWEAKMAERPLPRFKIPATIHELLNVARLSDKEHLVGPRLYAAHRQTYPLRPDAEIRRLKEVAQERHPCR